MDTPVTVIKQETHGAFTVQAFNFADTWLLTEPCPASWHKICYRVIKNGKHTKNFPPSVARAGSRMVDEINNQKQIRLL